MNVAIKPIEKNGKAVSKDWLIGALFILVIAVGGSFMTSYASNITKVEGNVNDVKKDILENVGKIAGLQEGQKQIVMRQDRADTKLDRVEAKIDRILELSLRPKEVEVSLPKPRPYIAERGE